MGNVRVMGRAEARGRGRGRGKGKGSGGGKGSSVGEVRARYAANTLPREYSGTHLTAARLDAQRWQSA